MGSLRLLPGERLETRLRPHPLSWLPRYFVAGFPAILGLALALTFRSAWWQASGECGLRFWNCLYGEAWNGFVFMFVALAAAGAIVAVASIRWRVFFGYVAIGLVVTGLSIWAPWAADKEMTVFLVLASIPYLVGTEIDRSSHEYHVTNLRILFSGGMMFKKERSLKFEAITDLDGTQGPLARMLNYGTLIPVTQSGFGLGADSSDAHVMVGAGAAKGGVGGGIGVAAGGGKEVSTGRAKTFHQLTGVRPYGDTKFLLEKLIQEATATPYLREQVELQRQMVHMMGREPPIVEGRRLPKE